VTNADETGNEMAIVVTAIVPAAQAGMRMAGKRSVMLNASEIQTAIATASVTATATVTARTVIVIARAVTTVSGEASASVRTGRPRSGPTGTMTGNVSGGVGMRAVMSGTAATDPRLRSKTSGVLTSAMSARMGRRPYGLVFHKRRPSTTPRRGAYVLLFERTIHSANLHVVRPRRRGETLALGSDLELNW